MTDLTIAGSTLDEQDDCPECVLLFTGTPGPLHHPSPFCKSDNPPHCRCEKCF